MLALPLPGARAIRLGGVFFSKKQATSNEERQARVIAELTASRRAIADAYEVERARIERDLHDGAQQYLVAASMKLGEALLDATGAEAELLEAAKRDVDRGLRSLRATVHGIHPQVLQDHGLVAALADAASAHGPHVSVYAPHPLPQLSASVLACGYFFGTEALTNAAKHAPGAPVSVLITSDAALHISVVDEGPGGAGARAFRHGRAAGGLWRGDVAVLAGRRPNAGKVHDSAPLGARADGSISMSGLRIVIADDSAILREGLAGLLERRGHEVVGRAGTAVELEGVIGKLSAQLPDVVITDVRMPPEMGDDGLKAAVALRRAYPGLPVMVLSQYVAPAYAVALFDSPDAGTGYLLKDRVSEVRDFLASLEVVAQGGTVIDPTVAQALMRSGRSGLGELSPREREVLELMSRGKSNKDIAAELVLSGAAVAKHVSNIFTKLRLDPSEDNRRVKAILQYLSAATYGG